MRIERFDQITARYKGLKVAIAGDFCLDRYLEIDPSLKETSIETGREVHNVVRVRSQPGGAGTILNNLAALGIGEIHPVGFCGEDGEGWELLRALQARPGVNLESFVQTPLRRTFTYCKPLLVEPGKPPVELNRLDSKNWSATPSELGNLLGAKLEQLASRLDALILLDQVDIAGTGVVTRELLARIEGLAARFPNLSIIADSRRGLTGFPPVAFKMNRAEFARMAGVPEGLPLKEIKNHAAQLAQKHERPVFVSLSQEGIVGAPPGAGAEHMPALPVRGEIDIVGAGDAVTANLTAAMASGAEMREALVIANTAASIVIHQLGTTGQATVAQIRELL